MPKSTHFTSRTRKNATRAAAAILCAATAGLGMVNVADAATGTWTNINGGSWNDPLNWQLGVIPNAIGDVADFSTLNITSDPTVTLDGNKTVGYLLFSDTTPGNNWTLSAGTAGSLTFQNGGAAGAATGNATLSVSNTTLTFGPNTPIFNPTGSTMYYTGNGTVILSTIASGNGTTGAGKMYLTGGITVQVGAGAGQNLNFFSATPSAVTADNITLDSGTMRYAGPAVNQSNNRGFRLGPATGSGVGTIEVTSSVGAGSLSLPGAFSNNAAGTGGLVKTGVGWLAIGTFNGAASTYSGPTTILGGTLSTRNLKDGGVASGIGISSNAASNLVIDGGTFRYEGPAQNTDRLFTVGAGGGTLDGSGTGAFNLTNAGAIAMGGPAGARTLTLTGTSTGTNSLNPIITDSGAGSATSLVKSGTTLWVLNGNNSYTGTTTVSDGTLSIGGGTTTGSLGSGPVTMNGGNLVFNHSNTLTVANAISGGGGNIRQNGTGATVLSGANTYTVDTEVNAGALIVTGSINNNNTVTLNNNAILGGTGNGSTTGFIGGNTNVNSGTSIRPGASVADGSAGTLTFNNLNLNGGADLRLDLLGASNDRINVVSTANVNGGVTITPAGFGTPGTYTVLTAGTLQGTAPTVNVPTGARTTYTVHFGDVVTNAITLDVVGNAKSLTWTGGNGPAWDVNSTQSWSDNGGTTTNEKFFNQDTVTFANGGTNHDVTLNTTVVPTAVNITNDTSNPYSLTGGGNISGATTTVNKTGNGLFVIATNNDYAGGTTISAGTLQLGNGSNSGSLGTGNVTNNANLVLNRNDTYNFDNVVQGTGNLTQAGAGGTVILRGNNTYSGTTTVNANSGIQIGDGNATGSVGTGNVINNGSLVFQRNNTGTITGAVSGTGTVQVNQGTLVLAANNSYGATVINGGATLRVGSGTTSGSLGSGPVTDNGTLVFNRSDSLTLPAGITGSGGIQQSGSGTLVLSGANTYSGPTIVGNGTVVVSAGSGLGNGNGTLQMGVDNTAGYLDLTQTSVTAPGLTTGGNTTAANTINIGAGRNLTINGNVSIGGLTGNNTNTVLNITGGGSLVAGSNGGVFAVGNQANGNAPNVASAVLDLSGISTFVANYSGGTIGVGTTPTGAQANAPFATLILANNSTLTADTLRVGFSGASNTGQAILKLGQTSTINANTISVASGKGSASGTGIVQFNNTATNPTTTIRGADGVSRVGVFKVADYSENAAGSSTAAAGAVDFTGGTVNALIDQLQIGIGKATTGTPVTSGTFTFNAGTVNVNGATLGILGSSATAPTNGTLAVNGGNLIVGPGGVTLSTGGGTITTGALVVGGGSANLGADIADGGGSSSLILRGGVLNMGSFNIGSAAAPIDNILLESGTINGATTMNGAITKNGAFGAVINGPITGVGVITVNQGQLNAFNVTNGGTLTINAGGTMQMIAHGGAPNSAAGTSVVPGLTIAPGGTLDLTNNSFVIDYADGSVGTLVDDVRQHLQAGRIKASFAEPNRKIGYGDNAVLNKTTFGGVTVDASSLLMKYTYGGDANLDGQVDVTDLGALATAWQTSAPWTGGDFNYDGFVDVSDLGILATDWQLGVGSPLGPGSLEAAMASVGLGNVSVPEPTSIGAAILCLAAAASRRQTRRSR